jgi:LPXTG-motif cell wall-anchored protein
MGRQKALALSLSIALVALGSASVAAAQGQGVTVELASQNNSGITGTATLAELDGGRVRVDVQADGAGAGPEPTHIHAGSCSQLDATPAFVLQSVTNGKSTTEVQTTLQQLTSSPHAIHMHKSADELTTYVACANLVMAGQSAGQAATLPRTGEAGARPGALLAGVAGLALLGLGYIARRRRRQPPPARGPRASV